MNIPAQISRSRLFAILFFGAATGCVIGGTGDDETGGVAGICNDAGCEIKLKCVGFSGLLSDEGTVYLGFCGDTFSDSTFDEDTQEHCEKQAASQTYDFVDAQFAECPSSLPDPDGCTSWTPASRVHLDLESGIYQVDRDFVESTIEWPAALWDCDTARIYPIGSGSGYELTDLSRDDLFYALGLRNDDIFVELNGSPIVNYPDIVITLTRLHLSGEDEFDLVVQRHGSNIAFMYEVSP